MNVDRLQQYLQPLFGIRPQGVVLSVGELWSDRPQLILSGFSGNERIEFANRLGRENIPRNLQTQVATADIAFEEFCADTIEAARRTIEERVSECNWGLSIPHLEKGDLLEQGADNITKLAHFQTLSLKWQLDVHELNYHSMSVQPMQLVWVIPTNTIQHIFTKCRS
ncbi:MAG: hypothetical protein Q7S57_04980 [bacterium]|nr:hypothetical protein [bacterium]